MGPSEARRRDRVANPEIPKSVDEVIELMPQTFSPEAAQGLKAVYQFNIIAPAQDALRGIRD